MWELDRKEGWGLKNGCFWTMMLEKSLESPLDCKEIQPVPRKGDHSWIFFGKMDAEAETPNTLATWCEELTHWKRPWCWGRLKARGEGDGRGWDGWMASPTEWCCRFTWTAKGSNLHLLAGSYSSLGEALPSNAWESPPTGVFLHKRSFVTNLS